MRSKTSSEKSRDNKTLACQSSSTNEWSPAGPYCRLVLADLDSELQTPGERLVSEDELIVQPLIESAKAGDWRSAQQLVERFAADDLGRSPLIVQYLASCFREWANSRPDPDPKTLPKYLNLVRPEHREPDAEERHQRVLARYLESRASGTSRDNALKESIKGEPVGIEVARFLIRGIHGGTNALTKLQLRAIREIRSAASDHGLDPDDVTRSALGKRGMNVWLVIHNAIATPRSKKG